jgi:hypothetical protein
VAEHDSESPAPNQPLNSGGSGLPTKATAANIILIIKTDRLLFTDCSTVYEDRLVTTRINADLESRDERQPFEPLPFFDEHLGHPGTSTSMSIHEARQYVYLTVIVSEFLSSLRNLLRL